MYFKCNILRNDERYYTTKWKIVCVFTFSPLMCVGKFLQVDRMALESKKYSFENVVEEINFCCAFYSQSPSCRWCRNVACL